MTSLPGGLWWTGISFFSLFEGTWCWYFLLSLILVFVWVSLYTFTCHSPVLLALSLPSPKHTMGNGLSGNDWGAGCHPSPVGTFPKPKLEQGRQQSLGPVQGLNQQCPSWAMTRLSPVQCQVSAQLSLPPLRAHIIFTGFQNYKIKWYLKISYFIFSSQMNKFKETDGEQDKAEDSASKIY